jgi:hypothetical protein
MFGFYVNGEPASVDYTLRMVKCQSTVVRCPGHTIHIMGFGYENFIEQLIELAGIQAPEVFVSIRTTGSPIIYPYQKYLTWANAVRLKCKLT